MAEEEVLVDGEDDETVIVPPLPDSETDDLGPAIIAPESGETVVVNNITTGEEGSDGEKNV